MSTGLNKNIIDNQDRGLLGLAVKCRLISIEQEKKILSVFIDELNKNPDISIVQIFREKKYLSEEEINFLLAVKKHLKMKMLDKKFGELGVANKFIHPEKVKKAIDLQSELFKETQESKLIGDILLEQKEISKANKAAIMLTQDRVKDELLAQTINDIASTEMEKITINMRFGAIAVKKKFISLEQLNQAITVQKSEAKENKIKRYLGEILKELFDLSDKDTTDILKIQKEFEKQRLSLEKALSLYNRETTANKRLNKLFEYSFSKNKLEAHVQIVNKLVEDVLVSDVISWLKSIGISYGICDEKSIEDFLEKKVVGSEIKIAKGYAPLKPVKESMEFSFNTTPGSNSDDVKSQELVFVKKGDILAKITPHKEGKPGQDVCGFHIAPPEDEIIALSCGEGVVKKGTLFLAEIDGNPTLYKNRTLFVTANNLSYPTKHLTGNIGTDLGTQYQTTNIKVDGSIETGGIIICNEITVEGYVKGQIRAAGRVQIDGDAGRHLNTEEKSTIISSDEDIVVKKNIVNSIVITSKNLSAPNSDLISSKVFAFQDVILKNIHSEKDRPSLLQVGINPSLKANAIKQTIDEKNQVLQKLLHKDELKEIENWFNGKIQMQNNYQEQQTILQNLLKLFSDKAFDIFETFEQKTKELMSQTNKAINNDYSHILESTNAREFIDELLKEIHNLSQDKQKAHLQEMLDIKFGMYKAAVNATQRYKNEYKAREEFIMKKIKNLMPDIDKMKLEIEDLYVKKDYLKLSEANISAVNPVIRVKNQVDKGTIIKGRKSILVIDQTIFGVKFSENRTTAVDTPQIIIEGFYD